MFTHDNIANSGNDMYFDSSGRARIMGVVSSGYLSFSISKNNSMSREAWFGSL